MGFRLKRSGCVVGDAQNKVIEDLIDLGRNKGAQAAGMTHKS